MQFALQVPGRGAVAGSLLYYPFENEAETLPLEDPGAQHAHITTYNLTQARPRGPWRGACAHNTYKLTQARPRAPRRAACTHYDLQPNAG